MKITFLISDLDGGGAQKIAVSLMKHWSQSQYELNLITLDGKKNSFFTVPEKIKHVKLHEQKPSKNFIEGCIANFQRILKIRASIKSLKPDCIVSFIAPTNILAILATAGLQAKLIISERNDPSRQSFGKVWNALRFLLYRFSNVVTANSEIAIETMKAYVPEKKLHFIPNYLHPPNSEYVIPFGEKEDKVIFVGRLHPQKGLDILLKAWKEIDTNWELQIIGQGRLEQYLKNMAQTLEINVEFTGQVENPYKYFSKAKIFVMPSRHEGTPNALLEAMSCNVCPIISSAVEGGKSYIHSEKQLFHVDDPKDLSQKLKHFIQNEKETEQYAEKSSIAVKKLNNLEIFKQWDDIL